MNTIIFDHIPAAPWMLVGAAAFGIIAVLMQKLLRIGSRPAHMPPGPPTVPFFGNQKQVGVNLPVLRSCLLTRDLSA